MKKFMALMTLLAFLAIPTQSAFAWTYDGLGSLNPFTGFRNCNPCRCKMVKCKKPKLTKCEKLHGVKYKGEPCGCAAPIIVPIEEQPMNQCNNCHRAF